jgi:Dual-action HEIGH metallo-peptidase
MRTIEKIVTTLGLLSLSLASCKKQITSNEEIPQAAKDKIFALGFSTEGLQRIDDGYLVEGDIAFSNADLDQKPRLQFVRIAGNEQYRTFNLLTALPRTLTISISNKFPSSYISALDEAIQRFNTENLQVHFQRANSDGDIEIIKAYGNFVANSGLPSANGTPYRTIKLNTSFIGNGIVSTLFINYLATLMAHEIGHCIGFRHTDYMNRSFSCAGHSVNEGAGLSGAVNIPGTPVSSDSGSWMLACITINQNRPFNDNDKTALSYLY